jgi:hypothetical protein
MREGLEKYESNRRTAIGSIFAKTPRYGFSEFNHLVIGLEGYKLAVEIENFSSSHDQKIENSQSYDKRFRLTHHNQSKYKINSKSWIKNYATYSFGGHFGLQMPNRIGQKSFLPHNMSKFKTKTKIRQQN